MDIQKPELFMKIGKSYVMLDIKILDWYLSRPVLSHGENVPL